MKRKILLLLTIYLLIVLLFDTLCNGVNLEPNCIAHWKMNDNAATATVVDSMGNHNGTYKDGDGDINTDTGAVTGKINGALDFDGDEYIEIADHNDFTFGDGTNDSPFSISAWIYRDTSGTFYVITKSYGGQKEWIYYVGYFEILKLTSPVVCQGRGHSTTISTGQWYHIALTYNGVGGADAGAGMKIYIDGERKDDFDEDAGDYTAMDNGTQPVWIGKGDGFCIDGKIDNVAIFNKELTQEEINFLYNNGNGREALGQIHTSPIIRMLIQKGLLK